jgi:hypothetical protein
MIRYALPPLCLAALAACGAPARAPAPPESAPAGAAGRGEWLGFDAYPGARQLCAEHVTGDAMHLEWRSYATAAAPEEVVAFYRDAPGEKTRDHPGALRLAAGDLRLTIFPVAEASRYPSCAEAPAATERTVILVSKAIR